MRKLLALLFVAAAFTFTACNKKDGQKADGDSTAAKTDSAAGDSKTQEVVKDSSATGDSTATKDSAATK